MPNQPSRAISGYADDRLPRLIMSRGGSDDSEMREAMVTPVISSPRPAVTTLTPAATRRRAEWKCWGSNAVSDTR